MVLWFNELSSQKLSQISKSVFCNLALKGIFSLVRQISICLIDWERKKSQSQITELYLEAIFLQFIFISQ